MNIKILLILTFDLVMNYVGNYEDGDGQDEDMVLVKQSQNDVHTRKQLYVI